MVKVKSILVLLLAPRTKDPEGVVVTLHTEPDIAKRQEKNSARKNFIFKILSILLKVISNLYMGIASPYCSSAPFGAVT